MMKRCHWPVMLWGVTTLLGAARAQESKPEPIITDRPDFTDSTETVPTGMTQIEGCFTYSRSGEEKAEGHPAAVFGVLSVWIAPGSSAASNQAVRGPPVLAPLAFCGLGLFGVLAYSRRFPSEPPA